MERELLDLSQRKADLRVEREHDDRTRICESMQSLLLLWICDLYLTA